jgi:hypothetical protein
VGARDDESGFIGAVAHDQFVDLILDSRAPVTFDRDEDYLIGEAIFDERAEPCWI